MTQQHVELNFSDWLDDDWSEIRKISDNFIEQGMFSSDEFKCICAASIIYALIGNATSVNDVNISELLN